MTKITEQQDLNCQVVILEKSGKAVKNVDQIY